MSEEKKPTPRKKKPAFVKMLSPKGVALEVHPDEVENYKKGGCEPIKK